MAQVEADRTPHRLLTTANTYPPPMRIVVVGGGFGALAAAVRLAKLGHEVTLFEASDRLGGAIGSITHEGFTWQTGPTYTLVPAVIRDLYVKSGRKVEREFDLVPTGPQRHLFTDGTAVDLPAGSRAEQLHSLDAALGQGAGRAWLDWVAPYADTWAALRRDWFEKPYDASLSAPMTTSLLRSRTSLWTSARSLGDPRLRALALADTLTEGHRPSRTPAWWGVHHYLRQTFDTWTVPAELGGMARVSHSLTQRLSTRRVEVRLNTPVLDVAMSGRSMTGVRTAHGDHPADAVVVGIDPKYLPALARLTRRLPQALPPHIAHLGLEEVPAQLEAPELVVHGDPHLVVRTQGAAVSVLAYSPHPIDPITALATRGIDLRQRISVRIDVTPSEQSALGSPLGVAWNGRSTLKHRIGTRSPIEGVYMVGAHTTPGAGMPYVGLSAALAAQVIGPAR